MSTKDLKNEQPCTLHGVNGCYSCLKKAVDTEETKKAQEWYAKERGITIEEFDDYDAHVCRVAASYHQSKFENLGLFDVSQRLDLNGIIINPIDKDGDFKINMEDDCAYDVNTYLSTNNALKLASYIITSLNGR